MTVLRFVLTTSLLILLLGSSCQPDDVPLLAERRQTVSDDGGLELLARIVHVSDTHIVDEESPARLAMGHEVTTSAWRSWESYSTQLLDGVIRTANRVHASGRLLDFVVHTGDACDNAQRNELDWFLRLMEGGVVTPLSGQDDRTPEMLPAVEMDPHAPFQAQGLYRSGIHGELPTVPWYVVSGNHDVFSVGVFPISNLWDGRRVVYLPLQPRAGFVLPSVMDPTAGFAYGKISPANPGPPELFNWPVPIVPVAERAFFSIEDFVGEMLASESEPPGHGFAVDGRPWYSVAPVPGLRLIGLYTSDLFEPPPGQPSWQGSVLAEQLDWFRSELDASTARGESIIVATHHPSGSLEILYGSVLDPDGFRNLLNEYPAVILHLAGHEHRNRVADRGGYIEIETCSTLDWPQEARLIELWRDEDGSILIGYEMLSHVDETLPALGSDPLVGLRREAMNMAQQAAHAPEARGLGREGTSTDRTGLIRLSASRSLAVAPN